MWVASPRDGSIHLQMFLGCDICSGLQRWTRSSYWSFTKISLISLGGDWNIMTYLNHHMISYVNLTYQHLQTLLNVNPGSPQLGGLLHWHCNWTGPSSCWDVHPSWYVMKITKTKSVHGVSTTVIYYEPSSWFVYKSFYWFLHLFTVFL